MIPKIYLHIGLPKTATTSLQMHAFPEIARICNYTYVGVNQPRGKHTKHHPLYSAVLMAIDQGKFEEFEDQLSKLSNFSGVVISEEMITVSTSTTSWDVKLENLSKLLKGHEYEILVTIREPKDAIFSYYIELYESMKSEFPQFHNSVVTDPCMGIYRYASFVKLLESMFKREHIHYASFCQIIKNDFSSVLKFLDADLGINVEMSRTNNKKSSDKYVYVKGKENLYKRFNKYERARPNGPIKIVLRIINLLILRPLLSRFHPTYKIRKMSTQTADSVRDLLQKDTETFEKLAQQPCLKNKQP